MTVEAPLWGAEFVGIWKIYSLTTILRTWLNETVARVESMEADIGLRTDMPYSGIWAGEAAKEEARAFTIPWEGPAVATILSTREVSWNGKTWRVFRMRYSEAGRGFDNLYIFNLWKPKPEEFGYKGEALLGSIAPAASPLLSMYRESLGLPPEEKYVGYLQVTPTLKLSNITKTAEGYLVHVSVGLIPDPWHQYAVISSTGEHVKWRGMKQWGLSGEFDTVLIGAWWDIYYDDATMTFIRRITSADLEAIPAYALTLTLTPSKIAPGTSVLFAGKLLEDGVPLPNVDVELWSLYPPPSPQEWLWLGILFTTDVDGEYSESVGTRYLKPGEYRYKTRYTP